MREPYTEQERLYIAEMWRQGAPTAEIARRMGRSKNAIIGIIFRLRRDGMDLPIHAGRNQHSDGCTVQVRRPVEPEPEPDPPVIDPDSPSWQCPVASCRMTKQPGRDYCASHIPMPARMRANMSEVAA